MQLNKETNHPTKRIHDYICWGGKGDSLGIVQDFFILYIWYMHKPESVYKK